MKFFIDQKVFRKILEHITQSVEKKNVIPILGHLLIQKTGNLLKLTGVNMNVSIEENVEVHSPQDCEGSFTAPAHLLHSIVSKLPNDEEIEVNYDDKTMRVTVEAPNSQYHFSSFSVADFPLIQPQNYSYSFEIPSATLHQMIWKTAFSMSDEEIRRNLNGVCLYRDPETHKLTAVATDGHRLAETSTRLVNNNVEFPEIVLPAETITILNRLLINGANKFDNAQEIVKLDISSTSVRLSFANLVINSKLLQGVYPSYKSAIPQDNPHKILVKKQFLSEALARTSIFADEQTNAIKAIFSEKNIHIDALSSNIGSGAEEIILESGCSEKLDINFNVNYLMDVLKHSDNELIEFAVKDDNTAVIIKDHGDANSLFALMPLE